MLAFETELSYNKSMNSIKANDLNMANLLTMHYDEFDKTLKQTYQVGNKLVFVSDGKIFNIIEL